MICEKQCWFDDSGLKEERLKIGAPLSASCKELGGVPLILRSIHEFRDWVMDCPTKILDSLIDP